MGLFFWLWQKASSKWLYELSFVRLCQYALPVLQKHKNLFYRRWLLSSKKLYYRLTNILVLKCSRIYKFLLNHPNLGTIHTLLLSVCLAPRTKHTQSTNSYLWCQGSNCVH